MSCLVILFVVLLQVSSPVEGKTPKDLLEGNNWDGTSPNDEPG